ncbi:MAG TPA: GNAT family N-acetyltransferase [Erysipelothrix sp.]
MNDYSYRKLKLNEIEHVFDTHLYYHFPDAEIKPFWKIEKLYEEGYYHAYVMEQDQHLYGYAFLIIDPEDDLALLDYFAINPSYRGQKIGSTFLKKLPELVSVSGILIESEIPDEALNQQARQVREKRIDFYLKNGAILTPYYWQFYDVGFNLLYLPTSQTQAEQDLGDAIRNIAALSLSKEKLESKTKLILLSER